MVKRFSVIITPFAAANVREAYEWLSARNPAYAKRWLTAIRDQIPGLDTLPKAHPVAPESAGKLTPLEETAKEYGVDI